MIEDSSWSDKHGRMFVKENGRWRPAMLGEYPGLAEEGRYYAVDVTTAESDGPTYARGDHKLTDQEQSMLSQYLSEVRLGGSSEHWRVIAVVAILVAMVLAFVLVLS